ncbi:MAG: hypothetical protein Q4P33_04660 [Flaviflexus sp.]|nr:hypothetical protein [Flaviflexus sp.]
MEKARMMTQRVMWFGVALITLLLVHGGYLTVKHGMHTGLVAALIAGAIGWAVAIFGARRPDLAWWSGGMLMAGLLVPSSLGLTPFVLILVTVITAGLTFYLIVRDERRGTGRDSSR